MKHIQIKINTVKRWTTHMTMLIKVLQNSEGPVVEVGGGPFSTPLLHWMCRMMNRKLVTYENEPSYYQLCKGFQSTNHRVKFIEKWDDMDFKKHCGVVFIDHHPDDRRVVDIINFKDTADFIVIHDTEREEKYDFPRAWKLFKYRHTWNDCVPFTSVVSNKFPLTFLK